MRYIVANWKEHKSIQEALDWLTAFKKKHPSLPEDIVVVVAAPYIVLPELQHQLGDYGLHLAAQDSSAFREGPYTGEVGAAELQGLVEYVIVGHSERRMFFGETNDIVTKKATQALNAGIHPFVCIADLVKEDGTLSQELGSFSKDAFRSQVEAISTIAQKGATLVFEPVSAISTFGGKRMNGKEAVGWIQKIKDMIGSKSEVMYGGSVTADSIMEYWQYADIAGVMPGAASLDPNEFAHIVDFATQN